MMNFGSAQIKGGFYSTKMLTGYVLHGPDGLPLASGTFDDFSSIDPPEEGVGPSIGTVAIVGDASPTEGDVTTYSASNTGDASTLLYAWSIVGGTGSSSSATCQVTWGDDGPGQVSCTITSTDADIQDSPSSGTLSVTIQPTITSIGTLNLTGDFNVSEGDTVTYSVTNAGDAGNLSYLWSITGGTGSSTTASCNVVWGTGSVGQVNCTVTSGDDAPSDSPQTVSENVTISDIADPTPNAPTNISITTSDYVPPVQTSIGTVTISGETSPTEGDVDTYSVTNDGDAGNLSYAWSITGGTGSSTTDTCEVTWGPDGSGDVSCTITSADDAPTDSPASDTLSVVINPTPTTTPAPGGGITPVNDNQARFYLPASATSYDVTATTSTGYFRITDGTNDSITQNGGNSTNYSSAYYSGAQASLSGANLISGDRVIRLYPCDVNGVYDDTADIRVIALTSVNNTVGPTAVDISYLTGLEVLAMMSDATDYYRVAGGSSIQGNTPPSVTEIRAINVSLGTVGQSYSSKSTYQGKHGTYTYGYSGYVWGQGCDIGGQLLDAAALDQFYTDLANGAGSLIVGGNSGVSGDTPTIASNKGYTVYKS